MSNETRTMLVVLLVCGFLMCGCIVLPIGVGVGFFYLAAARNQVAMAQEAIAIERAAEARAQADAEAAQNALDSLPASTTGSTATPPVSIPGLPLAPTTPTAPAEATPPAVPMPPIGAFGLPSVAPDVLKAMLADVEKRKELYRAFKQLRETEEQIKALGGADPTAGALFAGIRQQALDAFKASGLTQEDIDKILAEGDKEGW